MPGENKISAKSELLGWLGQKDRTVAECRERLAKKKYGAQETEEALTWAVSRGYLNDRAYAERYCNGPARRRAYSSAQVQMKLLRLGVERSIVLEALSRNREQDVAAALRLLGRKRKNLSDNALRLKAIAGLRRRGFSFETVRAALKQLGSSFDETD